MFIFFFNFYDLSHLAKHIIKTSLTKKGCSKNRESKIQAWRVMGACECGMGSANGRPGRQGHGVKAARTSGAIPLACV